MKVRLDKTQIILYGLMATLAVVSYLFFGHYLSLIMSKVVMTKESISQDIIVMVIFFLAFILISKFYKYYTVIKANESIEKTAQSLIAQIDVKSRRNSENMINAIMVHLEEYRTFETTFIPTIILTTAKVVLIIIALFFIDYYAALILLFTAPFIPLYYVLVGLQTQDESLRQATRFDNIGTLFLNLIRGKDTVTYTDSEATVVKRLEEDNKGFVKETMHILKYAFQSSMMLEFITILGIGLVALEVALRIIIFQNIDFYTAFFVLLLAPEFYSALKVLGTEFHNGKLALGSYDRVKEILSQDRVNEHYRSKSSNYAVEGKNVTLSYGDKVVLNQSDFNFNKSGFTAITGESGTGKSTLLRAILGLHEPSEGQINVLTDEIGYVSDQVYFSDTSIYEYISNGKYSEEKVLDIIDKLKLSASIENLEDGIHTPIVNHNIPLSGGEIVRLKMARVLIDPPAMIIMDEPTEFLDATTEELVMNYLNELKATSAIIAVIHRRQLLNIADEHYIMDDGRLKRGDIQ